jgi:hypothetical protein
MNLLIGNGVNLLSNGYSWSDLLKEVRAILLQKGINIPERDVPFILKYEELAIVAKRDGQLNEEQFKFEISNLLNKLTSNPYHAEIMNLPFKHIFTTNYDYNLEKATGLEIVSADILKETKYSLFRRKRIGQKYV